MSAETGRTAHIAWTRTGDRVDVVFLHGYSDSGACWDPIVRIVAARCGVLVPDARGHGASALPDGAAGPAEQALDAAMVLDQQPTATGGVVVVGHSMGAGTAIALAASRPDLVRGLVLEDPMLRLPDDEPRPPREPGPLPASLVELRALSLGDRIACGSADNPSWPEDELEPWARSKADLDADFVTRRTSAEPAVDLVSGTSCPVLLLRGDPARGSIVTAGAAADAASRGGGRIEVVAFAGVGHSVRREERSGFFFELGAFLGAHSR